MTPDQLTGIMPRAPAATDWAAALTTAMTEADISTPQRQAAFLAQVAHESVELTHLEENLSYSADRLVVVWPKRFTPDTAALYARNPEKLANFIYAGRNGNGDEGSGDGWRFRGRGPFQLTGRGNYDTCQRAIGIPVLTNPGWVALEPLTGARTAGWYWTSRHLNVLADEGDFGGITKAINGALLGLAERQAYFRKAMSVLAA